jgi:hypothetical protein
VDKRAKQGQEEWKCLIVGCAQPRVQDITICRDHERKWDADPGGPGGAWSLFIMREAVEIALSATKQEAEG